MEIDQAGLNLLTKIESCSLKAYPDAGGWSIGYGHHGSDVYEGMRISASQAKIYLKSDVAQAEGCINRNLAGVPLKQNEFNALVSLAYNRGCTGFVSSDVYKKIKEGKKTEAAQAWINSGVTSDGKVLDGLVSRRAQEAAMFAGYTVTKPSSDSAAMVTGDGTQNNLPDMANTVGSINWKTVGLFAGLGLAVWAGNKYAIPYYQKITK